MEHEFLHMFFRSRKNVLLHESERGFVENLDVLLFRKEFLVCHLSLRRRKSTDSSLSAKYFGKNKKKEKRPAPRNHQWTNPPTETEEKDGLPQHLSCVGSGILSVVFVVLWSEQDFFPILPLVLSFLLAFLFSQTNKHKHKQERKDDVSINICLRQ